MSCRRHCSKLILFLLVVVSGLRLWAQGPPYQTDDPEPVDLHQYEFYIFGSTDGTPVETDATGPAIEFNWGAIPANVSDHTEQFYSAPAAWFCSAVDILPLSR
jgi:hypothetical protein